MRNGACGVRNRHPQPQPEPLESELEAELPESLDTLLLEPESNVEWPAPESAEEWRLKSSDIEVT